MPGRSQNTHRLLYMLGLIVAGEAVYTLPFHVTRFFRPTVLEVFSLTNTELGAVQGVYGVVGMFAYFAGGPLADMFSARRLMAASLWSTAAGGLYMATIPSYQGAMALWAFFGITTIILLWAALIRATREWGSSDEQGRAYGLLEGGRGVLAAILASTGVAAFSYFFPDGIEAVSFEDKKSALSAVILGYTAVTAAAGIFVWFVIPESAPTSHITAAASRGSTPGARFLTVMRMPAVWMQALIVVCAYVGYKGFDNYVLFAVEEYGMSEVDAAAVVALGAWMRPIAALTAGLLGDRFRIPRMTAIAFALLLLSNLFFALNTPQAATVSFLVGNILVASAAIFGLRGMYFALMEDAKIPAAVTGTAVGLISVVGYTPDIFTNYIGGMLLDRSPGLAGHQHFFMFLAAFAAVGLATSLGLMRTAGRRAQA